MSPNETFLIVDDDNNFRKRLARAFRERGLETLEAQNSSEALELLEEIKFSKIVLDLKIDKESGLELLPQLLKKNPQLKVLVLTGYGTISTAVQALKLGAVNYLTKPAHADLILGAFDNLVDTNIATPSLEQVEWEHINRVVKDASGNISQASKALGLHRRSLQRKLSKHPDSIK